MKIANTYKWPAVAVTLLLAAGPANASTQSTIADAETRWTATTQMTRADRDRGVTKDPSHNEFPALVTTDTAAAAKGTRNQTKSTAKESRAPNTDFWFYDADVVLFNDNDRDGFYHGVDVLFDADTIYTSAEVYAVLYLSLEGGPWNEFAVTDDFLIQGASSADEYVVVTELVSGYPTGSYDLLIELFDTYDGAFVASFGPADTSKLAFLQLEDAGRDAPQVTTTTTVVVREGGGGVFAWFLLLPMLLVAAGRYWQNCARNGLSRRL